MPLTPPPSAPPAAPAAPGDAPSRANPTTFRTLADAFVVWLVGFRTSVADLRTWLATYISWAGTHISELEALQLDVSNKQSAASTAAGTAAAQADIATTQGGIATTKAGEASSSASLASTKSAEATAAAGTAVAVTVSAANAVLFGGSAQVVGAGDSIMSGLTAPNTVTILTALAGYHKPLSLSTYTNDGVPGSRLDSTVTGGSASGADMVVRYAANVFPKRPAASGSSMSILFIDIGANDFPVMTAAQVPAWITAFENYCATARTDGFLVVAFTVMPRTGAVNVSEKAEENRRRMNDAIRRSVNIDAYVDAAQLLTDSSNATYFLADGSHPNDTGNRLLGRAAAAEVARLGQRIPAAVMPAANANPVVTPAMQAALDAVSIECLVAQTVSFVTAVPALGAGDFSIEWWHFNATGANNPILDKAAGSSFGIINDASGYGQLYNLPNGSANWSAVRVHYGYWNHLAIVRSAGVTTYYLNGAAISSIADATAYSDFSRIAFTAGERIARLRVYSRALSAAEVLASYQNLSEYREAEASYTLCLEDGNRSMGGFVEDLSPSGAHLLLTDKTKVRIRRPARRGVFKTTTVGSVVASFPAAGSRITSYSVDVTVSGGGTVNLGDTNGGGEYMPNTVLAVGKKAAPLASPFPVSGSLFVNAVGYTIKHTIYFEAL